VSTSYQETRPLKRHREPQRVPPAASEGYHLLSTARLPYSPGAELPELGCWPVAARSLRIAFTTDRHMSKVSASG